jgi:perosamine synthetase
MDIDLLQNWLEKNTATEFVNGKPITTEITSGKKIGAIVPVYVLGGFVNIDKLVGNQFYLWYPLIEIVQRHLEAFKNEKHAGTFGLTGVLSFNGNKIISTGGGG